MEEMLMENNQNIVLNSKEVFEKTQLSVSALSGGIVRTKAFYNALGANALVDFLKGKGLEIKTCLHDCSKMLAELEVSDVQLENLYIDVRAVFDENELFIPKKHFDLGILPDIYLFVKVDEKLENGTVLGFIKPEHVNTQNKNQEFYFVNREALSSPVAFSALLKSSPKKVQHAISENADATIEKLIMLYMDNDIDGLKLQKLLVFLKNSEVAREKLVEFENFERLSYFAIKEFKNLDVNDNDFTKYIRSLISNDEFSNFETKSDLDVLFNEQPKNKATGIFLENEKSFTGIAETLIATGAVAGAVVAGASAIAEEELPITKAVLETAGETAEIVATNLIKHTSLGEDETSIDTIPTEEFIPLDEALSSPVAEIEPLEIEDEVQVEELPVVEETVEQSEISESSEEVTTENDKVEKVQSAEVDTTDEILTDETSEILNETKGLDISSASDLELVIEGEEENLTDFGGLDDLLLDEPTLDENSAQTEADVVFDDEVDDATPSLETVEVLAQDEGGLETETPLEVENTESVEDEDVLGEVGILENLETEEINLEENFENVEELPVLGENIEEISENEKELEENVLDVASEPEQVAEETPDTQELLPTEENLELQNSEIDLQNVDLENIALDETLILDETSEQEVPSVEIQPTEEETVTFEEEQDLDLGIIDLASENAFAIDEPVIEETPLQTELVLEEELPMDVFEETPEEKVENLESSETLEPEDILSVSDEMDLLLNVEPEPIEEVVAQEEVSTETPIKTGFIEFVDDEIAESSEKAQEQVSSLTPEDGFSLDDLLSFEDDLTENSQENSDEETPEKPTFADDIEDDTQTVEDISYQEEVVDAEALAKKQEVSETLDELVEHSEDNNTDFAFALDTQKKSSNNKIVIAILSLLALIGVSGALYFVFNQNNASQQNNEPEVQPGESVGNPDNSLDIDISTDENSPTTDINIPVAKSEDGTVPAETLTIQKIKKDFSQPNTYLQVSKIVWDVPEYLTYNDDFSKYLQNLGSTIKVNLTSDLLLISENTIFDKVKLKIKLTNSGKSFDVMVADGSGVKSVDDLVLQSVKNTLNQLKPPVNSLETADEELTVTIYL